MKPAIDTTMRYDKSKTANFETCLITSTTIDAPLNLIGPFTPTSMHGDYGTRMYLTRTCVRAIKKNGNGHG